MADLSKIICKLALQLLKTSPLLVVSMVTKLDTVVTYHEGLPHVKSLDTLITWPWKITWQTEIISPLPQSLWPLNLGGMVIYLDGLLHIKSRDTLITWLCEIFTQLGRMVICLDRFPFKGFLTSPILLRPYPYPLHPPFWNFVLSPSLFLLPCFFGLMCDHARSDVIWTWTYQALVR